MSGTSNLKERFTQLQGAKERSEPDHACPRIQRVADHLRDRKDFTKHYTPKLVSMGPIHHGEPKLRLGEHYKQMWASTYFHNKKINPNTLHKDVGAKIDNLKGLFDDYLFSNFFIYQYHNQGFASMDEMISWTLLVDGCALLHILEHAKGAKPEEMMVKVDQLVFVMQDVLLMENQLPYQLLKLLWGDQEEGKLIEIMIDYLGCHHWATLKDHIKLKDKLKDQPKPCHLLDLQRNIILLDAHQRDWTPNNQTNGKPKVMVKYRNIKELMTAGIRIKSSRTPELSSISFTSSFLCSELTLPEIRVDRMLMNLLAYETCPDFQNEYGISAYICFLNSLIDHPDDVKLLRSKQILLSSLGSDEEVANLFNTIGTDLVDIDRYACLKTRIDKHYKNRCKTWLALAYHTYFSNSWSIIAFHAAILGLVLTFIQTWYAMRPPKK